MKKREDEVEGQKALARAGRTGQEVVAAAHGFRKW